MHDDVTLRVLYNAADVMVVPSLQEAFGATGLLDIVDHQENGYLAEPFNVNDLAEGIDWVLQHSSPQTLANHAVKKIRVCFDYRVVAPEYIELYRSVFKG